MEDKTHDALLYLLASWPSEQIPERYLHDLMHEYTAGNPLFRFLYDTNWSRPYSEELDQMMQRFLSTSLLDLDLYKGLSIPQSRKERLIRDPRLELTREEKEYLSQTAQKMYEAWTSHKAAQAKAY